MSTDDISRLPARRALAKAVTPTLIRRGLAQLDEPEHGDFAVRVLRAAGIPEDRYDSCVLVQTPAGGLYAAYGPCGLTASLLSDVVTSRSEFEDMHWRATGRRAIRTSQVPTGLRTAVRTGRTAALQVDDGLLDRTERAVLAAVRAIPRGQLRPLSWVARDAGIPGIGLVLAALAHNPLQLLVPCHRVTHDNGRPCDAAYGAATGDWLRRTEGLDPDLIERLVTSQTAFLGSDITRIFCHPTCWHARRITGPHQVPFRSAAHARRTGYRPCRRCRPVLP